MKTIGKQVLGAVVCTLVSLPMLAQSQPASNKSDQEIAKKIRHELVMLPYYGIFDELAFRVEGNKVTLLGAVTRPTLKSDAERAVKRVEGVGSVSNNIEVLPLSPFDERVRVAEYRAIFGSGSLYRYAMGANPSIHIIVDNGNVTLEGVVGSEGDKNLAGIRANGVFGVFSVKNNLAVVKG